MGAYETSNKVAANDRFRARYFCVSRGTAFSNLRCNAGDMPSDIRTCGQSQARRPYVIAGVYPQSLRVLLNDIPSYIRSQLESALKGWEERNSQDESKSKSVEEIKRYYEAEFE